MALERPSDAADPLFNLTNSMDFEGWPDEMASAFKKVAAYLAAADLHMKSMAGNSKLISAALTGKDTTGLNLGMGQMPNFGGLGFGTKLGLGVVGAGVLGMGVMPSTAQAVALRTSADTVAGLSGLSAASVIARSNRAVGGGATSALGPTMATMSLAYQGGYLPGTVTSNRIMSQIGGLSALTGQPNEVAAGAYAGVNAMNFLRIGAQVRDTQGNLKNPTDIINSVYNFLYRGRSTTAQKAAFNVLSPTGAGYDVIRQVTGGDQNLMQQIQMGVILRAKNAGKPLDASTMGNANAVLDQMGIAKDSPLRSNFKLNTSEAGLLQATQSGLVGGYNASLNAVTAANNGLTKMATNLSDVTRLLGGLKGVLETLPGLGGVGGTVSGLGSLATSVGMMGLQNKMLTSSLSKAMGVEVASASRFGFKGFLKAGLPALGLQLAGSALQSGAKHGSARSRAGNAASYAGMASLLNVFGPEIGIPAMLIAGAVGAARGGGDNSGTEMSNVVASTTSGIGGGQESTYHLPVPKGTPVSSPYGLRKGGHGVSSNHQGVDFGVRENTPIFSSADGIVTDIGNGGGYGNYIIIKHGKKSSLYAHLNRIEVRRGQKVKALQRIALSGGRRGAPGSGNSTGPHLHHEIRDNGGIGAGGRVDPLKQIGRKAGAVVSASSTSGTVGATKRRHTLSPGTVMFDDNGNLINVGSDSLSNILSGLDPSGAPLTSSQLRRLLGSSNASTYLNTTTDLTSGDRGGIAGGSRAGLMRILRQAGFTGAGLQTAFSISLAESGGRAGAVGDVRLQDATWGPSYGMFQIRSLKDPNKWHEPWRDGHKLTNPMFNARAAFKISHGGTNFKPWSTFTSGSYAKFMDDALATAKSTNMAVGMGGGNTGMYSSASSSNATVHAVPVGIATNANVAVNVNMNVKIERASHDEVKTLLKQFKHAIIPEIQKNLFVDKRLKEMGAY